MRRLCRRDGAAAGLMGATALSLSDVAFVSLSRSTLVQPSINGICSRCFWVCAPGFGYTGSGLSWLLHLGFVIEGYVDRDSGNHVSRFALRPSGSTNMVL